MTISDIKTLCKEKGSHFFDASAMRFFNSKVYSRIYKGKDEKTFYFITSEQFTDLHGKTEPRRYTVHKFDALTCSIDTLGEFQAHCTKDNAKDAIKQERVK